MPVHDWTRVDAGIFHDFHHAWIEEIKRALNSGLLPDDYYALAEQRSAGFGPDVLTLQTVDPAGGESPMATDAGGAGLLLAPPTIPVTAETDLEYFRRKQSSVVVRHASGDHVVACVEIVSLGNKSSRRALRMFVEKVSELLHRGIHLVVVDLHPPGRLDPNGIHGAVWEEITGDIFELPVNARLAQAAYEADIVVRTYVKPLAVGETLSEMPLFLQPKAHVPLPLDMTYERAFGAVPKRWRNMLTAG